jgi:hypothetical protein
MGAGAGAMGLGDILGGLGAGVGLFKGLTGAGAAEDAASDAAAQQAAIMKRIIKAFDLKFGTVQDALNNGQFDPNAHIDVLKKEYERDKSTDEGSLSAALRRAGYQPGDSELGRRLFAQDEKHTQWWEQLKESIRRGLFSDKMNALGMLGGDLGQAAGIAGDMRNFALNSMPDVGGAMDVFSTFLNKWGGAGADKTGGNSTPTGNSSGYNTDWRIPEVPKFKFK